MLEKNVGTLRMTIDIQGTHSGEHCSRERTRFYRNTNFREIAPRQPLQLRVEQDHRATGQEAEEAGGEVEAVEAMGGMEVGEVEGQREEVHESVRGRIRTNPAEEIITANVGTIRRWHGLGLVFPHDQDLCSRKIGFTTHK